VCPGRLTFFNREINDIKYATDPNIVPQSSDNHSFLPRANEITTGIDHYKSKAPRNEQRQGGFPGAGF
jgi:hypothetical protein